MSALQVWDNQVWNNIIAYTLQIGLVVGLGALVPVVLRLRIPRARLLFWQVILVACLALPWVRPWRQEVVNGAIQVSAAITAVTSTSASTSALAPGRHAVPFREIALWLLAAGVIIRLALLGVGLARLAAYRRRGREIPYDAQMPGTRAGAVLLLSDDTSGPVTFGWFRPVVLLPSRFPSLGAKMREAILRHELMHVNRRDWLFTIAEELVRAVLWFHPAIWWVIGEIQLAREQTVDQAVIEATGAREPYLDALLLMAGVPISSPGSAGQMDLAPAPMFLRRRHLKRRLMEAMREVRMATISKTRLACMLAAAVAMVAAACWLATGAFPLSAAPQVVADAPGVSVNMNGSQLMHRSPVAYPADARAKGVEGTVVVQVKLDANGEVADATALSGPDELRKAARQSVLTWHFDKSVAMTTQVVNIDFSKLAAATTAGNALPADKVLFDQATRNIEQGNYEAARRTLNTLITTYDTSEYLARAKLAIADSWFREGGANGLAQAEAEYKDFILFYPDMKEAAESRLEQIRQLRQQTSASVARLAAPPPPPPPPPPLASGKLARIIVTGLSDSARDELLSHLPIREGGEWSPQVFSAVSAAAKEFDSHLLTALTLSVSGEPELIIGPGLTPAAVATASNGGKSVMFRAASGSGGGLGAGIGGGIGGGSSTSQITTAPVTEQPRVFRVGNGVSQPRVVFKVDPVFPEEAGANQVGGAVILSCVIGTEGKPEEIHVVKSLGTEFDVNAINAVQQWVFKPGMLDGVPVQVRATIEVNFRRL
jgi:TonB family protein